MQYVLPYGKGKQSIFIPNSFSVEVISGEKDRKIADVNKLIEHAFSHPLYTAKLVELVHTGDSVVIVVDDHTRPCPSKQILPFILRELEKANVSSSDICILIATGTHMPPNRDQLVQLLGKKIVQKYTVICNDNNTSEYVSIGCSSFGHEIKINKLYVDATVKIILSDIEYHYFAGYGGTRKSILPGIASSDTIQQNHSMMFDEAATTGELEKNPVSTEMKEALDMIGCDYSIGVVLDQSHEIVGVWTGDAHAVMDKGITLVDRLFAKKIRRKPDMVITSADGHPHDINLYQALKAVHTASKILREKGIIILVAECKEGMGNKVYKQWLDRYDSSEQIKNKLHNQFQIGAHKAYYHRDIIEHFFVHLSSSFHPAYVQKNLGFTPVKTAQQAFDMGVVLNDDIKNILIVPQGSTTRLML